MKKFGHRVKAAFMDESGQGATEYILLLVVVVGLVIMFKGQIRQAITTQLDQLSQSITSFNGN